MTLLDTLFQRDRPTRQTGRHDKKRGETDDHKYRNKKCQKSDETYSIQETVQHNHNNLTAMYKGLRQRQRQKAKGEGKGQGPRE
jgi:hypothetical protein